MAIRTSNKPLSRGMDGHSYTPLHKLFGTPAVSSHLGWGEQPIVLAPAIYPRYASLRTAMERHGSLSFAFPEKRIPSSWDLYYRAAAVPTYYPLIADKKTELDNLDFLVQLFTGSTFIELGSGDARKTIELLKKIPPSAHPLRICCVDIIKKNVKASIKAFIEMGYAPSQVIGMEADIVQNYFWQDLSDNLRGIGSPKTVVLLQGATYNNFERDEMIALLENSHHLPGDTTLLYAIDNTTDYQTLMDAYATVEMKHLLLSAAEPHFHMRRDLSSIRLEGPFWKVSRLDSVESSIKDATADISTGPYGPFQSVFFSVRSKDGSHGVDFVPIQKIPVEIKAKAAGEEIGGEMSRMFREAQVEVARRMPFSSPDFPKVEYSLYALRPVLATA